MRDSTSTHFGCLTVIAIGAMAATSQLLGGLRTLIVGLGVAAFLLAASDAPPGLTLLPVAFAFSGVLVSLLVPNVLIGTALVAFASTSCAALAGYLVALFRARAGRDTAQ